MEKKPKAINYSGEEKKVVYSCDVWFNEMAKYSGRGSHNDNDNDNNITNSQ